MRVRRGIVSEVLAQRPHQRLCGISDGAARRRDRVDVEEGRSTAFSDLRGGRDRDDRGVRQGRRERTLDVEHRREPRVVGDRFPERGRHEERSERGQWAKNTVAPSP